MLAVQFKELSIHLENKIVLTYSAYSESLADVGSLASKYVQCVTLDMTLVTKFVDR